ncbi:MAG: hypothetical protein AAB628_01490 [Patescibacteria group bacterium]
MRSVILDIGAGSVFFARILKWHNWRKRQLLLCGEPTWKSGVINSYRTRELIKENKTGIFRIISTYEKFEVEDDALDMVTLNAPHILMPPFGIESELMRCLKSGGVFFFSYPVNFKLPNFLEGTFTLLAREHFRNTSSVDLSTIQKFPHHLPHTVVPSKVMQYNIREHALRKQSSYQNALGTSYIYNRMPLCNRYEVWQKS